MHDRLVDEARVLERAWRKLPEGHDWEPDEFGTTCMAYLLGMRPSAEASERHRELFEVVRGLFTYTDPETDRALTIGTMLGAVAALEYPDEHDLSQRLWANFDSALEGVPPGERSDWFCMFCGRTWPSGKEPESACPDCGALLMRAYRPDEEQKAELTERFPDTRPGRAP